METKEYENGGHFGIRCIEYFTWRHAAAMLAEWNKETAAVLEERNILFGIELYSYESSSFCFSMQIWLLVTWAKTLYRAY